MKCANHSSESIYSITLSSCIQLSAHLNSVLIRQAFSLKDKTDIIILIQVLFTSQLNPFQIITDSNHLAHSMIPMSCPFKIDANQNVSIDFIRFISPNRFEKVLFIQYLLLHLNQPFNVCYACKSLIYLTTSVWIHPLESAILFNPLQFQDENPNLTTRLPYMQSIHI